MSHILYGSLVLDALDDLGDDGERFMAEARDWVTELAAHPNRYGDPEFEMTRQTLVRRAVGDPTWQAWMAWCLSRDEAELVETLWNASETVD